MSFENTNLSEEEIKEMLKEMEENTRIVKEAIRSAYKESRLPVSVSQIVKRTNLPEYKVRNSLMLLVLEGEIREMAIFRHYPFKKYGYEPKICFGKEIEKRESVYVPSDAKQYLENH
jgi:hypothetical protein